MATPTLAVGEDRAAGARLPAPRLAPMLTRLALLFAGGVGEVVGSQVQRPMVCPSPCTVAVTVTVTVAVAASERGIANAAAVPRYRDRRLRLCILMEELEESVCKWLYEKMCVVDVVDADRLEGVCCLVLYIYLPKAPVRLGP